MTSASGRRPFEPGDFARRIEGLGATVVRHDEPFDVAVIGVQASRHEETLTSIVQRKTPILNGAMLAKRLVTPSPRPDLVDVFGALLRFARAAEARPDVEIVRGFLGTVHDSLLRHQAFGGNVGDARLLQGHLERIDREQDRPGWYRAEPLQLPDARRAARRPPLVAARAGPPGSADRRRTRGEEEASTHP